MSELNHITDTPQTREAPRDAAQFQPASGMDGLLSEPSPITVTSDSAVNAVPDRPITTESATPPAEGVPDEPGLMVDGAVDMKVLNGKLRDIKAAAAAARAEAGTRIDAAARAEAARLRALGGPAVAQRIAPGGYPTGMARPGKISGTPSAARPEARTVAQPAPLPVHTPAENTASSPDIMESVLGLVKEGTIQPGDLADLIDYLQQTGEFTGDLEFLNKLKDGMTKESMRELLEQAENIGDAPLATPEDIAEIHEDIEEEDEVTEYADAVADATVEYRPYMDVIPQKDGSVEQRLVLEVARPDGHYELELRGSDYIAVSRTAMSPARQLVVQRQGLYIDSSQETIRADNHGLASMPQEMQEAVFEGAIDLKDPAIEADDVRGLTALISEAAPRRVTFDDLQSRRRQRLANEGGEDPTSQARQAGTEFRAYAGSYLSEGLDKRYGESVQGMFRAMKDTAKNGNNSPVYSHTVPETLSEDKSYANGTLSVVVTWPGQALGVNNLEATIVRSRDVAADGTLSTQPGDMAEKHLTSLHYGMREDNALVLTTEQVILKDGTANVVGQQETLCKPDDARDMRNLIQQLGFGEDSQPPTRPARG